MERLIDYFVPEKYDLDFCFDKEQKSFAGVAVVTGEVKQETIKFHAVNLDIKSVTANNKPMKYKVENDALVLFDMELGEAEIRISYDGVLNENMEGVYLSTYEHNGKTEKIIATQFESHYARQAFPCIDEPEAKAVFDVKINLPEGSDDLVLVNTPSPRMSTYLLAFVIGKFHGKSVVNKNGTEITTYAALNQDIDSVDFANEVAARSLEYFEDNFGVPYPLKKLDQVALPDFEAGAMENWGLVTYREAMLLVGKNATLGTKKSVAITVAHELSHQWFGNLVTMKWWDDLWLNESFASVMEYYAVDAIYPEYKIFEGFFTGDCAAALYRDAYKNVQSVHQEVSDPAEIATLFDGAIVYAKGARLMLMVIRLMGWENFCKGIKEYFEKFKYQNTVGDDLWKALAPHADFDPKKLIHAFIDRPGYPVIASESGDFARFTQKRFLLDGPLENESWPLPEVTEGMSGHYILNLTEDEFKARLKDFDKLGLEEKLRLLMDRDLITKAGLQSAASLVPLAYEFKNEDSAAVWNKVAALVANLKVYFEDESDEEKLLKKYVLQLIDKKLTEVGIKTLESDDENMVRLRANLLGLDYFAEDEARLKQLAKMYEDDYTKMDNEIRGDILSAKIYFEPEMAEEYLAKYRTVTDPEVKFDYLAAACLAREKNALGKLLGLLGKPDIVKPQDQLYLFIYLYRNQKAKLKAFDWLTKNWDLVRKMSGDKSLSDYPMFVARLARTNDELEKYVGFFGPMRKDPALSRAIEIGEGEIRARVELIRKYRDSVLKELRMIFPAE